LKLHSDFNNKIVNYLNKDFTEVESSLLKAYFYSSEDELLLVKFENSEDIYYYNLPKNIFRSFLCSDSKGSFFARKIKKAYPWKKVDHDIIQKAQPLSVKGEQLA